MKMRVNHFFFKKNYSQPFSLNAFKISSKKYSRAKCKCLHRVDALDAPSRRLGQQRHWNCLQVQTSSTISTRYSSMSLSDDDVIQNRVGESKERIFIFYSTILNRHDLLYSPSSLVERSSRTYN